MTGDGLESAVGETRRSVEGLAVEAGKVAEFADAIRDGAPVYRDPTVARGRGFEAIPAPPTFTRVWMFPHHQPADLEGYRGFRLGFDPDRTIHGEQAYAFERPVVVGDRLVGDTTLADVRRRTGDRGGEMTVATFETTYRDADDERVLEEETTLIETGRPPDPPEEAAAGSVSADADLVIEDVDRLDFVRYAGASGDFTRFHVDEPAAREMGYPDVFAQGMFTAGAALRGLTDRLGVEGIERVRARFTDYVWPGDSVGVDLEADGSTVSIEARAGGDRTVLTGSATVRR